MCRKWNLFRLFTFPILFFVSLITVCHSAEKVDRTIEIQYPSKQITGSTTVVGVPGCKYTFKVVGTLPGGTHIEWEGQSTTKGSWSDNVLYPYATGGGSGTYHIKAVLVGGEGGEGTGWEVDVDGTITDPVLTYSEPGEDTYFAEGQTTPTPQVDLKVTVTKPGGTKLEGVSVNFKAEKFGGDFVALGTSSSNSSGEATKTWNADVSARQRFTLKAGTGPSYENEVTGKKVYVLQLFAMIPTPSHFRTAKSNKTAEFKAELHDPQGIATSATESITFELTSNPRGSIQTPVSAVAGVATATYTPPNLTWWEKKKPSGNVKTVVTKSFRSTADTEYIYVLPTPGVDVEGLYVTIVDPEEFFISLRADTRQSGPPLLPDQWQVQDLRYVGSEPPKEGWTHDFQFEVIIDWGDGKSDRFIQDSGTGIGTVAHNYDKAKKYHITMKVGGNVRRRIMTTEGEWDYEYFIPYLYDKETIKVDLK